VKRKPPPSLVVTISLEGPVSLYPLCDTHEEEARLALDLLQRDISLDEQIRLWGEATLARTGSKRWRPA